jgi:hypothetical protein
MIEAVSVYNRGLVSRPVQILAQKVKTSGGNKFIAF